MNTVGGSVKWNLDVDKKGLTTGLASARSEVNKTAGEIDSSTGKISSAIKTSLFTISAAIGASATAFAVSGIKMAGDLESATQGFTALLGGAEAANATIDRIKKEAATTPFELPGLVEGTQALAAITKNGDSAIDILLDVGKAVAISGKGQAELDRVVVNLQQIASTGSVTAMDIRQFQSAIPIFNDILAASGLTTEKLQDSTNAAELLFNAFKKAGEEGGIAAEGFTAQAGTFNQLMSNLKDTIGITASEVVTQTGLFDLMKVAVDKLTVGIAEFGTAITSFFIENKDTIKEAITITTDLLNGLYGVVKTVFKYIEDNEAAVFGFFIGMGTVIMYNSIPAVIALASQFGALALSIAPLVIAGGTFALLFGFLDKFSRQSTGFGLLEQASSMLEILTGNSESALRAYRTLVDELRATANSTLERLNVVNQLRSAGQMIGLPFFADGVRNFSGGLAVVGEQGPEVVSLPRGSSVYSNDEIGSIGGKVDITNYITVRRDSDIDALSRKMSFEAQAL